MKLFYLLAILLVGVASAMYPPPVSAMFPRPISSMLPRSLSAGYNQPRPSYSNHATGPKESIVCFRMRDSFPMPKNKVNENTPAGNEMWYENPFLDEPLYTEDY